MNQTVDARLSELKQRYADSLLQKAAEIETAWQKLLSTGCDDAEVQFQQLHHSVHRLAGSAPTFGFSEVGERALELDRFLDDLASSQRPLHGQGALSGMTEALLSAMRSH